MGTSSMKFTNIPAVDLTPEGLSGMSIWTAPRLTMLVFFCQPIVLGSWLTRIPDVQQALGLGPACLALALLGLPAGTLLTLPFAGTLVGRIGAPTAIVSGLALHALAVSLPAFAPNLALAGRLHVVSPAPAVLAQGEA
jgi:MFS family permease